MRVDELSVTENSAVATPIASRFLRRRVSHLIVDIDALVVEDGVLELHEPVVDVQVRGSVRVAQAQADAALRRHE